MRPARRPLGQMSGVAEDLLGSLRRRTQDREPRVVVYDAAGHPRVVTPDTRGYGELLDTAERLIEIAAREA